MSMSTDSQWTPGPFASRGVSSFTSAARATSAFTSSRMWVAEPFDPMGATPRSAET